MKILLINPPKVIDIEMKYVITDAVLYNVPPLNLQYLYSYLSPYHDVYILDMAAEDIDIKDINTYIEKYKPDIVGMTAMFMDYSNVYKMAKLIKELNKDIVIVIGGISASIYIYETLQFKYIDYVISGTGQIPFLKLCNELSKGKFKNDIENVFTKENYTQNKLGYFKYENFDDYPTPNRIVNKHLYTYALTSTTLGCPNRCHFCSSYKTIVLRKPESIIKELIEIYELGIKSVMFFDELFIYSNERVKQICDLIIDSGIKLQWTARGRIDSINKELLDIMKKAGCTSIGTGIESGTERILKRMNKHITLEQIKQSVKLMKNADIQCLAGFMVGYPSETKEEILETINFAKNLNLDGYSFYITTVLPGTMLYKEWQKNNNYYGDTISDFIINLSKDINSDIALYYKFASDLFTPNTLRNFIKLAFFTVKNI